ncbi:ras-related protein Rab-15 isoform X1 [Pipra filicauda]|uniref:small monomeric GTPase n=2 Tax=Pipra filicauda TaxID=649802 RepID=A0A6J2IDW8_9PASS|nr:ras-related protein Rab-15 isoform X1 [Pipra filicauda]
MQPGTGGSGQPQHREAAALGNREHRDHLPGTSCQAWHRVWAPAPGHGGAWGGPGGNRSAPGDSSSSGGEHRDTPVPSPVPVPGVDFKMKTIEVDGIKVRIQIWDTAGQERYQTITKQYYRRAQGIFLVYDISSERSYQHIVKWASDVDEYAPDGVQKILIGNKADEEHKRQVPKEHGLQLAREYGMDFYETSACSNLNIKESFTRLTELVLQAHRKELEELRGPPRAPTLTRLEEEEQQPLQGEDTPKTCWC